MWDPNFLTGLKNVLLDQKHIHQTAFYPKNIIPEQSFLSFFSQINCLENLLSVEFMEALSFKHLDWQTCQIHIILISGCPYFHFQAWNYSWYMYSSFLENIRSQTILDCISTMKLSSEWQIIGQQGNTCQFLPVQKLDLFFLLPVVLFTHLDYFWGGTVQAQGLYNNNKNKFYL